MFEHPRLASIDTYPQNRGHGSIQHFVLTFFSDQPLEVRHDLVPPHDHRFNLILGQIVLGLFRQFVAIQKSGTGSCGFFAHRYTGRKKVAALHHTLVQGLRPAESRGFDLIN